MLSLLAILFPLLCTAFLPNIYREIERDFPQDPSRRPAANMQDTTTLGSLLIGIVFFTPIFGVVQWWLFQLVSRGDAYFTCRSSEQFAYSITPGVFLSITTAMFLDYYINRHQFGDNFVTYLDAKTNRSSNREGYRLLRPMALGLGISLSILNFLAYDCYLSVDRSGVRYNSFLSLAEHRVPIFEIASATQYRYRRGRNYRPTYAPYLKLHLCDGSVIATSSWLGEEKIAPLLQAIEKARGTPLPVTQQHGP